MAQDRADGDAGRRQTQRRIAQGDGHRTGQLLAHPAGLPGGPRDRLAAGPALGVVAAERRLDAGFGRERGGRRRRVLQRLTGALAEVRGQGVRGVAEQCDPAHRVGRERDDQFVDVVMRYGIGPGRRQQSGNGVVPAAEPAADLGRRIRMAHTAGALSTACHSARPSAKAM